MQFYYRGKWEQIVTVTIFGKSRAKSWHLLTRPHFVDNDFNSSYMEASWKNYALVLMHIDQLQRTVQKIWFLYTRLKEL